MIRTSVIFLSATILLAISSIPFTALQPGATFVGGHQYIGPDETLNEDVRFYFSQVTIAEGAVVEGRVFLFSSTLDLRGAVTEDIRAFESDLTLRETAHVEGKIDRADFIHWTLLLPAFYSD